jgi:hypothetical protein|tara:strand:+ start:229 stop:414 length:186 start_codon:yes stop_codon:yes gene_type:complete
MSKWNKELNGKELFEWLQERFGMTKKEALASMMAHKQDTSFLMQEAKDKHDFDEAMNGHWS